MTTVLTQKGYVALPARLRKKLRLKSGDVFEVTPDDENTITLRRVTRPANQGLIAHLLACPVKGWLQPID